MEGRKGLIPQPNRLRRWLWLQYLKLVLPFYRRRTNRPGMATPDGLTLATLPGVFHPVYMRAGVMLGRAAAEFEPAPGRDRALDMGCGSGVVGVYMARKGYQATCIDIDPKAVRLARANALLNDLESRMEVRQGDLFEPVASERFDLICFSPPYFKGPPKEDVALSRAFWSEGLMPRFAQELPRYLAPGGVALVHLSTDGDSEGFLTPAKAAGLTVTVQDRQDFGNEIMSVYALRMEKEGAGE